MVWYIYINIPNYRPHQMSHTYTDIRHAHTQALIYSHVYFVDLRHQHHLHPQFIYVYHFTILFGFTIITIITDDGVKISVEITFI